MLSSVLLKTLRDQWRSLAAWAAGLVVLMGMYAAFWPSIKDQPSMNDMLQQMPEAFRNLFATQAADMSTPTGYVQIELLSFMAPIVILMYAIGMGAGAIAGEEEHHTLELLLAEPVGRGRVVLEKAGAMVLGVALLAAVAGFALVLEGGWADLVLPGDKIAAAMAHLGLLGLVFGSLALALSASTGRPGVSKGIPAALAVLAYLVNGLAPVVDWLEPAREYSPFYQYVGHDPLRNGLDWPSAAIAVATAAVLIGAAVVGLRRRDTAA
ncbi:hypothetical protein GCM10012320_31220 [Sinomonas cellulolyticus]|uniref:ABC transporter permease subunit n=1 Tax=Sinomonas cellulolyticus TaxID=2801916 RepID=A0ABS1JXF5_9MICC|nr:MULTISPECIES: ABC transporter permease subunit [Sinomonas]MBL0703970.1 ABC transporter permease subunit [Sinomonas cellulolyticus]GHG57907.1 hypothetical protein GCM10012320_31220 [Sinomonas sp. KCTC 49339]